jgi:hypothetical protein
MPTVGCSGVPLTVGYRTGEQNFGGTASGLRVPSNGTHG